MEAQRSQSSDPRRVGVLLAGVGGVGESFARVLLERFSSARLHVGLVAIGDSRAFLCPAKDTFFTQQDVEEILSHKKRGLSLAAWTGASVPCAVISCMRAALHHIREQCKLDDYVVVDCTSSATIAPSLIEARRMGFAMVLANKLPLAGTMEQYRQLVEHQPGRRSPRVRYEATVGAGIPVVDVVKRLVGSCDRFQSIQGALSGTMTCILSAMNNGSTFSAGLHEARRLGIPEADPREDLLGADVARKMVILAREIGFEIEMADVEITPMLPPSAFERSVDEFLGSVHEYNGALENELLEARAKNQYLAYLGTVTSDGRLQVGLEHVPMDSLFATCSTTEGVISIHSEWFPDRLVMRGTGAGASSTAAAVLGDLAAIVHPV